MADPDVEEEIKAAKARPSYTIPLRSAAGRKAVRVDWIWKAWLAEAKLHLLAGEKGAGKSTMTFDWASVVSVGGKWPDGERAPLGDVLIWSGEDDFDDTILPRFIAAGGDRDKLYPVERALYASGETRPFDPATDIDELAKAARKLPNLKLIIIDPIVMAVSGDSHKNAETRRGLQPLVDLAAERRAALVGITHFTKGTDGKNPVERVTGSLAFAALARIVLAAAMNEEEERCRLVRVASNIGPSGGGFEYSLFQEPLPGEDFSAQRIFWGKRLDGPARDLLEGIKSQGELTKASQWLEETLSAEVDGLAVNDLKKAAEAQGFAWRTVPRAKEKNPTIVSKKMNNKWYWQRVAGTDYEPLAKEWAGAEF
jgi:putative DNA primase/helicase